MRQGWPSVRKGLLWMLVAVGIVMGCATWSEAKNCSGSDCVCGDQIVTNWDAGSSLGTVYCYTDPALWIGPGVTVNLRGTWIGGNGGECGLKFNGNNSTVYGAQPFGYQRGVCDFGWSGNTWGGTGAGSEAWSYGNSVYGVHANASFFTTRWAVVYGDGVSDEGIHYNCYGCTIFATVAYGSVAEQMYPFASDWNAISWNRTIGGSTGIHLKYSSNSQVDHNTVENSALHVRCASNSNTITNNTISNTFIRVQGGTGCDSSSHRPFNNTLSGNNITRNDIKINYTNPGYGNAISGTTFHGSGTDLECSAFVGGGTNNADINVGVDSVGGNPNGCFTVF
jgi:hypothetical protein